MYSKPSRLLVVLAVIANIFVIAGFVRPDLVTDARSVVAQLDFLQNSDDQATEVNLEESTTTSRPRATTTSTTTSTSTTTTTTTTTSTTTTTTSTTLPEPVTALEELARRAIDDYETVENITDYWVPILSQKWEGQEYSGIIWGYDEILELDDYLRSAYGAVLLWSGNYTSFSRSDIWAHIVPEAYYDKDGALDWCRASGISRADCGAKIVSHTMGSKGTSAWRP
jgi:hypothetical protein